MIAPAILTDPMFDRYIAAVIPSIIVIFFYSRKTFLISSVTKAMWMSILALYMAFSIACGRDYLAINRARHDIHSYLTNTLILDPKKIDAGFEYNKLFGVSDHIAVEKQASKNTTDLRYGIGVNIRGPHTVLITRTVDVWSTTKPINIVGYKLDLK
jgi:hypothetical protein